jgi:copper(I)-binding protein
LAASHRLWRSTTAALIIALLSCSSPDKRSAGIVVSDAWTRQIAPGQSAAAVYLTIANNGAGRDRLVDVETAVGDAGLHATSSVDGVARMRPLADGIAIAGNSTVELKPGGTHIMVTGLEQRARPGETIQLSLVFERSGERPVAARVVGVGDDAHSSRGTTM